MAVEMLAGGQDWPLFLAGSDACLGCWFLLQPGSVSQVAAVRPFL